MGNAKPGGPAIKFESESGFSLDELNFFYLHPRKDMRFGDLEELEYRPKCCIVFRKNTVITDSALATHENLFWLQQRSQLRCPNLLAVKGFTYQLKEQKEEFKATLSITFESFVSDADHEFISRQNSKNHFQEEELVNSLEGCFKALELLESNDIHHGYLTPFSLVMGHDGELKIADHGLLDREDALFHKIKLGIHLPYIAPELLPEVRTDDGLTYRECKGKFKADIFSLGMVFLHAALLEEPNDCYDWKNLKFEKEKLAQRLVRLKESYPGKLSAILKAMLQLQPAKRPEYSLLRTYATKKVDPITRGPRPLATQRSESLDARRFKKSAVKEEKENVPKVFEIVRFSGPDKKDVSLDKRTASVEPTFLASTRSSIRFETPQRNRGKVVNSEILTQYRKIHEDSFEATETANKDDKFRFVDPFVRCILAEVNMNVVQFNGGVKERPSVTQSTLDRSSVRCSVPCSGKQGRSSVRRIEKSPSSQCLMGRNEKNDSLRRLQTDHTQLRPRESYFDQIDERVARITKTLPDPIQSSNSRLSQIKIAINRSMSRNTSRDSLQISKELDSGRDLTIDLLTESQSNTSAVKYSREQVQDTSNASDRNVSYTSERNVSNVSGRNARRSSNVNHYSQTGWVVSQKRERRQQVKRSWYPAKQIDMTQSSKGNESSVYQTPRYGGGEGPTLDHSFGNSFMKQQATKPIDREPIARKIESRAPVVLKKSGSTTNFIRFLSEKGDAELID